MSTRSRSPHRLAAWLLLALLGLWGILIAFALRQAMLPGESFGTIAVVFPPDRSPMEMFDAISRADGRLIQATWFDNVWIVHSM